MFSLYWLAAFTILIALHFVLLPRIIAARIELPLGPDEDQYANRCFLLWSSLVALFTAATYVLSMAAWGQSGYLGTLFFLCAPIAWVFRWLGGGMREADESEGFDHEVGATLTGCIVGTALGWGLGWLVGVAT